MVSRSPSPSSPAHSPAPTPANAIVRDDDVLRLVRDAAARIARASDALADGESELATSILGDLEDDLHTWSAALTAGQTA